VVLLTAAGMIAGLPVTLTLPRRAATANAAPDSEQAPAPR
jgi:hypothetical protein